MKKSLFIAMAAVMCMSCAAKKKTVQPSQNPGYSRTRIEVPCKEFGFDNADYFRATGTATALNQQSARKAALQNAKSMIREKLGGFVSGLSMDYTRNFTGQAQASKVQSAIESEFATLVEKELNDADQTCEDGFVLNDGNFEYWISIQIPKKKLVEELTSNLSANEELEIEFNRDQFRKFAEEKMAKMKAEQK